MYYRKKDGELQYYNPSTSSWEKSLWKSLDEGVEKGHAESHGTIEPAEEAVAKNPNTPPVPNTDNTPGVLNPEVNLDAADPKIDAVESADGRKVELGIEHANSSEMVTFYKPEELKLEPVSNSDGTISVKDSLGNVYNIKPDDLAMAADGQIEPDNTSFAMDMGSLLGAGYTVTRNEAGEIVIEKADT